MKRIFIQAVVIFYVLTIVGVVSAAGISTTKHNLSSSSLNTISSTNVENICVFCHTPHAGSIDAPLWNRTNPLGGTFTQYTSNSLTAVVGKPTGVSLACLSCHDGVTAFDTLINKPGNGNGTLPVFQGLETGKMPPGITNLGQDLKNDHPISFVYDATLSLSDGGLVSPVDSFMVVKGIPLYQSKVECASCHNVHDNTNEPFLRSTNVGSALCLKCHIK
jgi:predicted CXXCH cytochrome family protein